MKQPAFVNYNCSHEKWDVQTRCEWKNSRLNPVLCVFVIFPGLWMRHLNSADLYNVLHSTDVPIRKNLRSQTLDIWFMCSHEYFIERHVIDLCLWLIVFVQNQWKLLMPACEWHKKTLFIPRKLESRFN